MSESRYLVTGVAGNLGSSVAAELLAQGARVRGLVLPGDPASERLPEGVEKFVGDVSDADSVNDFFEGAHGDDLVVIHCAAIVTLDPNFSQKVYDVNVTGTKNIVEACKKFGARKLVAVSSTGAIPECPHGTPITPPASFDPNGIVGYYGQTKAMAAKEVLDAVANDGLDATLVFPTGIAGPDDYAFGPVTSFVLDYCRGEMKAGLAGSFNAVDVRDLASAIVSAIDFGRRGGCYILGNEMVTIRDMFSMLSRQTGLPEVKTILPAGLAGLMGKIGDFMGKITGKPVRFTSYAVYNLTRNNLFDSSEAKRDLGFSTRPFEDTIADTVTWLQNEGKVLAGAAV